MRKVLFVILALALATCATAVLAQQAPPGAPPAGGPPAGAPGAGGRGFQMSCPAMALSLPAASVLDRATSLNLTDVQKTKLAAALTKNETAPALVLARQKAADATKALRDALTATTYDAANAAQLLIKAEQADVDIANAEIAAWTEIRAILTGDQVTQLTQMGRRGGFGGGNQPGQNNQGGRRNRGNQPGGPPAGGNAPAPPPEAAPGQ